MRIMERWVVVSCALTWGTHPMRYPRSAAPTIKRINPRSRAYRFFMSIRPTLFLAHRRFFQHQRLAILPVDGLHWAHGHAFPTVGTLVIVDARQVVFHVDGARGASLHAALAGNAAHAAHLTDRTTGIQGPAADVYSLLLGDQNDDVPWTGFHALAAGGAVFFNHNGEPVLVHIHCIEGAGLHAGTVAQTAVGAGLIPALGCVGQPAVLGTVVGSPLLRFGAATLAEHLGHPFHRFRCFHAQNRRHHFGHGRSTHGAAIGGSVAGSHCFREGTAAREAAAAAVHAGQHFFYG